MLWLMPASLPAIRSRFACLPDKETVERIVFVKAEIKGDFAVFHCGVGEHLAGDGKADGSDCPPRQRIPASFAQIIERQRHPADYFVGETTAS